MDPATRRLLIVVQLCYGVFPALGLVAMEAFAPRAVLMWRLFTGAAVLMALSVWRHGRAALPALPDLARLAGLSLLGVTINQTLFLEGLYRSTAVNAGLLMTVIPVGTVGLAAVLGHERLTRRRLAGITLSVAGVTWLFLGRGAALGASTLTGDGLLALNALSYSFYLVLAKPVLNRLPQLVVVSWLFTFGAATAPWFSLGFDWMPEQIELRHGLALAGVLVFPTILAYLLNVVVLSRTHASVTATYVMLQPFVAAALGILFLGERPELTVVPTALCVLAGLWLVSGRAAAAAPRDPEPVHPLE